MVIVYSCGLGNVLISLNSFFSVISNRRHGISRLVIFTKTNSRIIKRLIESHKELDLPVYVLPVGEVIANLTVSFLAYLNRMAIVKCLRFDDQKIDAESVMSTLYVNPFLQGQIRPFPAGFGFKNQVYEPTVKNDLLVMAGSMKACFLHHRAGDYASFPNAQNPAVLPLSYYKKASEYMGNCGFNYFYISSQSADFVAELMDVLPINAKVHDISALSELDTLSIFEKCAGGILSASTFSLLVTLMKRSEPSLYIAPKHWAGIRLGFWYPVDLSYIENILFIDAFCDEGT